jgi:hypothetical protein
MYQLKHDYQIFFSFEETRKIKLLKLNEQI